MTARPASSPPTIFAVGLALAMTHIVTVAPAPVRRRGPPAVAPPRTHEVADHRGMQEGEGGQGADVHDRHEQVQPVRSPGRPDGDDQRQRGGGHQRGAWHAVPRRPRAASARRQTAVAGHAEQQPRRRRLTRHRGERRADGLGHGEQGGEPGCERRPRDVVERGALALGVGRQVRRRPWRSAPRRGRSARRTARRPPPGRTRMARPTWRASPAFSSAKPAMASKPRYESTATEMAPTTTDASNAPTPGERGQPRPRGAVDARAATASATKTASTAISATRTTSARPRRHAHAGQIEGRRRGERRTVNDPRRHRGHQGVQRDAGEEIGHRRNQQVVEHRQPAGEKAGRPAEAFGGVREHRAGVRHDASTSRRRTRP